MASPKKSAPSAEEPKTAKKGRWAGKHHPWRSFPKRKTKPKPAAPPAAPADDDDGCGRGALVGQLRARYPEKYGKKP